MFPSGEPIIQLKKPVGKGNNMASPGAAPKKENKRGVGCLTTDKFLSFLIVAGLLGYLVGDGRGAVVAMVLVCLYAFSLSVIGA